MSRLNGQSRRGIEENPIVPAPEVALHAGDEVDGFVVQSVTPVEELRVVAYQLEHLRSGARLTHLHADDAENLFSINFPTPPPDDTGLPHILEHAVLSGSRKFPVRDPFFEMLKMSMATFLNAMTGYDCTYYPVASNVRQDLWDLAEVYFDAVFHPLLTEETFKREAHHLAPADAGLTISGVVYNEMKGAFSDPEMRLGRASRRRLFPDTVYGLESGGDPRSIPDLTYNDFTRFHQTYYHPGNAMFVFYGDIPTREYLAMLAGKLDGFERQDVEAAVARQPRWARPRTMRDSYPIGQDESAEGKTYVTINWLVGDGIDVDDRVALEVLDQVLLGHEAAPLKKALIDSKLGQDVIFAGYGSMGLETTFHVGLKGTEANRADAMAELVRRTLTDLVEAGIDAESVDAAFQQIAYEYREIRSTFPLDTMERVMQAWPYGADPLLFLRMDAHIAACRRRYEAEPDLFGRLIRERLLDNPHALTLVLAPESDWQARTDAAFAERMKKVRAGLSDDDLDRLAAEADELDRLSAMPNPPEALAKLPQLKVADLPDRPKHIPTTVDRLDAGVEFLHNDVFANGVNYLHLDFDLRGLPIGLWPYLGAYCTAIGKLGAAGMGYEQIARRVAAATGGIRCWPEFYTRADDPGSPLRRLRLTVKTLDEKVPAALDVLGDLVFALDPRDAERLRDMVVQVRAWLRTELVQNGRRTAARHAGRGLTPEGHLDEVVSGLGQLPLMEGLAESFDSLGADMMAKIEAVRDFLLDPGRLTVSFTGSDTACDRVRSALSDWIGRMRPGGVEDADVGFKPQDAPPREGLAGPIQVAYCAQVIPAPHYSHADEPLLTLGAHLVGMEYILPEVRFKGNAYGAWCRYSGLGGKIWLGSYRDPRVAETLEVFASVPDYVRRADWTQTQVDRAIIATAKNDEKPIRPAGATATALHRHLSGQTPELRQRRHERVLAATVKDVRRAMLDALEAGAGRAAVCVVAGREKLEEANRKMKDQPLAIADILR